MSILLEPSAHAAAYSNIPVVVDSANSNFDNFKYIVSICYADKTVSDMESYTVGNNIWTAVTTLSPHGFVVGESVFFYVGSYLGYYTVMEVLDPITFVINRPLTFGYVSGNRVCKYIRYKYTPDADSVARLDLSYILKDYVHSNMLDINGVLDGAVTRKNYFLVTGEEYTYTFNFFDNVAVSGKVGFYDPAITDVDDIPYIIGDTITIQQDLYSWDFSTISDNGSGFAQLTGSVGHSFSVGDILSVIGSSIRPEYNGVAYVTDIVDSFNIVIDKSYNYPTSTIDFCTAYATINPTYNTTTTILDIYNEPALGGVVVIKTNINFGASTSPIGGTIKYTNNRLTTNFYIDSTRTKCAYNARIDRGEYYNYLGGYSTDAYRNKYILANGTVKDFSTILLSDNKSITYRIEPTTKSWLLTHLVDSNLFHARYIWYASYEDFMDNTPLGISTLPSPYDYDAYMPVGIYALINCVDRVDVGAFDLVAEQSNIKYYSVYITAANAITPRSRPIHYAVNEDCSYLDKYHIVWKDAMGSWLSYPFIYSAEVSTNVTRNEYYKRESYIKREGTDYSFNIDNVNRGSVTYSTRSTNKIALTSGWVKDSENRLFEDMIKSTEVYIQMPLSLSSTQVDGDFLVDSAGNFIVDSFGNNIIVGSGEYYEYVSNAGELLPATLENTDIAYKTIMNDSVYNYSPVVRIAYNDYRF